MEEQNTVHFVACLNHLAMAQDGALGGGGMAQIMMMYQHGLKEMVVLGKNRDTVRSFEWVPNAS